MKKVVFLLFIVVYWVLNNLYANASIDWEEVTITSEYNIETEILSLHSSVFSDGDTWEEFWFEMIVWDEKCNETYSYNSFQLSWKCGIEVFEDKIQWLYKGKIIITSEDEDILYSNTFWIDIKGYDSNFSWRDFQTNSYYDKTKWELKLSWYLNHDVTELFDGYKIKLWSIDTSIVHNYKGWKVHYDVEPFFNDEYSSSLTYDAENNRLQFSIYEKYKWSLKEDEFGYAFKVFDTEDEEVWSGVLSFTVFEQQQEDDINWKIVEGDSYFNEDEWLLYIKAYLTGINTSPNNKYSLFFSKDKNYIFNYDAARKELAVIYSVVYDKLKSDRSRTIWYSIKDGNYQTIDDGRFKIYVDYDKTDFSDVTPLQEQESVNEQQEPSKLELVVDRLIEKQQQKYPETQDLKDNLNLTIKVLNIYAEGNMGYKSIIDELNSIIQTRINNM